MSGELLHYLIPFEIPGSGQGTGRVEKGSAHPEVAHSSPFASEIPPKHGPTPRSPLKKKKSGEVVPFIDVTSPEPPLLLRLGQLESAVGELETESAETAQRLLDQKALLQARVDLLLGRVEAMETTGSPRQLLLWPGLATALLVPLVGIGLNGLFHFGLYEIFMKLGEPDYEWFRWAAETVLDLQITTERTPHLYFYWLTMEFFWTSLIILVGLGSFLRFSRGKDRAVATGRDP